MTKTRMKSKAPARAMLAALLSAALVAPLATPAAAAPDHRNDRHVVKKTVTYKTFRKGQKFDRRYARNYQVVDYHRYKRLKAPPRGYHYVRSGSDVLLVGVTSGIVAAVVSGMFR